MTLRILVKKPLFSPRGYAVLIFVALILAASLMGQLQQSGGPGSAVTATQTGTWTVQPGNTPNTSPWLFTESQGGNVNIITAAGAQKVDGSAVTQPISGTISTVTAVTAITNALPAGTNVIGTVNTIPKTACGNTVASQALAAVPTSSTAVFSSTTCLEVIILNNTNAGTVTVTVTDNAGTPINDLLTFVVPGLSQVIQPLWGVAFTTGMKWSASGTGVTGAALGYQ